MKRVLVFVGSLAGAVVFACSSSGGSASPPAPTVDAAASDEPDAGSDADAPDPRLDGRPYDVLVPKGYDASKPAPLVLAFHGYGDGDNGALLEKYFRIAPVANAETFLYVTPNGTKDKHGQQFWNGTNVCCDFELTKPDDVGYIRALVADVQKKYAVDPKRIYAVGLSGGGVFVHRLACDAADVFAAVISVSGTTWKDPYKCKPSEGIAIAEIHGDKDDTILYEGGITEYYKVKAEYPGAVEGMSHWATYLQCKPALAPAGTIDLVANVDGAETKIERYDGCARGTAELWTVQGGVHAPLFGAGFTQTLWGFLKAHPKP
jgi:polyhydroxybutyrate depolymerase